MHLLISYLILVFGSQPVLAGTIRSTASISYYASVRVLDKYGHSEQLQNALKAANLQGSLVVAARDPINNTTVVLSLLEAFSSGIISQSPPSMLQLVNNDPSFLVGAAPPIRTAMVCTGLRADAHWLLRTVRRYSHRVWTRYNTFLDAPAVAHAVSKYFRLFWGYDEEEEWTPTQLSEDLEGDKSWSWDRPLGVVAIVLSSNLPYLLVIEPSGVVQRYNAYATGKYSSEILEKLGGVVMEHEEGGDLKSQLVNVIRSVVSSTKNAGAIRILVETFSDSGISRTIVEPKDNN